MDQPSASSADLQAVKRTWALLHGIYGNRMLDNWRTGKLVDGEDHGIAHAQRVWLHSLRRYRVATLGEAVTRCKAAYPHHPPTLGEFEALCVAIEPRPAAPDPTPLSNRLGMDMSPEAQAQRQQDVADLLKAIKAKLTGGATA